MIPPARLSLLSRSQQNQDAGSVPNRSNGFSEEPERAGLLHARGWCFRASGSCHPVERCVGRGCRSISRYCGGWPVRLAVGGEVEGDVEFESLRQRVRSSFRRSCTAKPHRRPGRLGMTTLTIGLSSVAHFDVAHRVECWRLLSGGRGIGFEYRGAACPDQCPPPLLFVVPATSLAFSRGHQFSGRGCAGWVAVTQGNLAHAGQRDNSSFR